MFGSYHWREACSKDRALIPGRQWRPRGAQSDWQRDFHVYAVEWTADRIDFFADGALYFTRTAAEVRLPTSPMYIILDQAVDSWLFPPGTGPAAYGDGVHMLVDFVRVYKASADATHSR